MAVTPRLWLTIQLELTERQTASLRSCLQMEVDRTHDNEGYAGSPEDELENMRFRADLLEVLIQLAENRLHYAKEPT